jgi:type II secretory pathway pseudopilin PulG
MLVVIVLILILATLTVALTPRIADDQRIGKGVEQLQGWLLQAKTRAKRDQVPTGLRLVPDSANLPFCRELRFVQQPDDFTGGSVAVAAANLRLVIGTGIDFTGGFTVPNLYPVQPGDYIEIGGGGMVHRIDPFAPIAANRLTLLTPFTNSVAGTTQYRIMRRPRLSIGEAPMLLPQDVIIDTTPNNPINPLDPKKTKNPLPAPNADGSIDILFAPSGALLNFAGSTTSFVSLWVRDVTAEILPPLPPTDPPEFGGYPNVVAIQKRTGFIAIHPVDLTPPPAGNPYSFVTDGKSSGL